MIPTSIDGTDITGATIDGQDVQEITVDGDTVFTAVPAGAFDVTQFNTTPLNTFTGGDSSPRGIRWSTDGTKFYEMGRGSNQTFQFSASTPFDISTLSLDKTRGTDGSKPEGIIFSPDGTKFLEGSFSSTIFEFDVNTAFDIATFNKIRTISNGGLYGANINGFAWNDDGTKLYTSDGTFGNNQITEIGLGSPFSLASLSSNTSFTSPIANARGCAISNDGTKFHIVNNNSQIHQFELSAPFDLTSRNAGTTISITSREDMVFNSDGTKLYTMDGGDVVSYTL